MTCRINHANETLLEETLLEETLLQGANETREGVNETRGAQAPSVAPGICCAVKHLVCLGDDALFLLQPVHVSIAC
jgi:hypothetical protein